MLNNYSKTNVWKLFIVPHSPERTTLRPFIIFWRWTSCVLATSQYAAGKGWGQEKVLGQRAGISLGLGDGMLAGDPVRLPGPCMWHQWEGAGGGSLVTKVDGKGAWAVEAMKDGKHRL